MSTRLVLASGSVYRRRLLHEHGFLPLVVPTAVDERAVPWTPDDVDGYVVALARLKLRDAVARGSSWGHEPGSDVVVAADQVVIDPNGELCHQQRTAGTAIAQLMRLSGSTHRLVNGIVIAGPAATESFVDHHRITMRSFTRQDAAEYVRALEPFDCAGSYRLEDDADLVERIESDDPTGIIGLPMIATAAALARFGVIP